MPERNSLKSFHSLWSPCFLSNNTQQCGIDGCSGESSFIIRSAARYCRKISQLKIGLDQKRENENKTTSLSLQKDRKVDRYLIFSSSNSIPEAPIVLSQLKYGTIFYKNKYSNYRHMNNFLLLTSSHNRLWYLLIYFFSSKANLHHFLISF